MKYVDQIYDGIGVVFVVYRVQSSRAGFTPCGAPDQKNMGAPNI